MKTTDVAMIAGEAFGLTSSHVAEIIRRIRERDLYVRETRSKNNRPKATARHLANLVAALMAGASSRTAADAIERVENCIADCTKFQKFFRTTKVSRGDDYDLFFNDDDWNKKKMPHGGRAPLHKFVEAACDDSWFGQFSLVDLLEILIEALANYDEIFTMLVCSEITYDPDRNCAEFDLMRSEWNADTNDYDADYTTRLSLPFADESNDYRGMVARSVVIDFKLLLRFAKALRRGDT